MDSVTPKGARALAVACRVFLLTENTPSKAISLQEETVGEGGAA